MSWMAWRYRVENIERRFDPEDRSMHGQSFLIEELNRFGREGWEAWQMEPHPAHPDTRVLVYLRKPLGRPSYE